MLMIFFITTLPKAEKYVNNTLIHQKKTNKSNSCYSTIYSTLQHMQKKKKRIIINSLYQRENGEKCINMFILQGEKLYRKTYYYSHEKGYPQCPKFKCLSYTVNWTALHIPLNCQEVLVCVSPVRPLSTPSQQPCQAAVRLWAGPNQRAQPGPVLPLGQLMHSGFVASVYFPVSTSDILSAVKLYVHCLVFWQHSLILSE